jgi:nicotinamide-nucleotide amidase
MTPSIEELVAALANCLKQAQLKLITAESCTGGGLAYALTSLAGSSSWFERGLVTYSNQAKRDLLGVKPQTLTTFGAVSEQTAREMAEGALLHTPAANISVAITGIAGPDGGSPDKPLGTVWFAWSNVERGTFSHLENFSGDRKSIREQAVRIALEKLIEMIL